MFRAVLSAIVAVALSPLPSFALEPIGLYGSEVLRYRIDRDGRPVGHHVIRFQPTADGVRVTAETEIAVRLLFLTAYRFSYRSESLWRDGHLLAMNARSDDDGTVRTVSARRQGKRLNLGNGAAAPLDSLPTDHWHPETRYASVLLNTLTGQVNGVTVSAQSRERVPVGDGQVQATRWQIDGELRLDTWYDDAGRWLGMRFAGRDGSTIRYTCEICTPSSQLTERP